MPELPEVETVRAGLAASITGATARAVTVLDERSLKRHDGPTEDFIERVVGSRVEAVVRRGKFLWMPLAASANDGQFALVGHLGMSGQMLLRQPSAEADKLTRITIDFETEAGEVVQFRFIDQRLFGSLAIDHMVATKDAGPGGFSNAVGEGASWQNQIASQASHIARDPLDPHFDTDAVVAKIRSRHSGIKGILLDQAILSGIGNIYADEALWRSKLHFEQPGSSLSRNQVLALLGEVTDVLAAAVEVGGTSFDEQYKNVNGESGYFEISLNAYGRTGSPCARCGAEIKRESWRNRGSHFCPRCQRLKVAK